MKFHDIVQFKTFTSQNKEEKKNHISYKENPIRETANFSMESLKRRGVWTTQEPEEMARTINFEKRTLSM